MTDVILPVTALIAAAVIYARALRAVRRNGDGHWSRRRTAAFGAGLLVSVVAVLPPLADQTDRLFSVNVVQQLVLSLAGPILLCLGAPVRLLLDAGRARGSNSLGRFLRSPLLRALTHPVVTWVLFSGTVFVLYFSGLFEVGLRNDLAHQVVQLQLLVTGVLFFAPVVGADPHPWPMVHGVRLVYVLLTLPVHAFSALALMSATTPLALDWYSAFGRTPAEVLGDQKVGAAIRWAVGDLVALGAIAVIVGQWVKDDEANAAREDEALAKK